MTHARQLAAGLAHHAAHLLSARRPVWAEAMRHEVDSLEDDVTALRWAMGCVVASYAERINPMKAASFWPLVGVVALTMFVFGGYILGGGEVRVILEALPVEFITVVIGALAASTILTATGGRGVFRSIGLAFQGRRFRAEAYRGLGTALIDVLDGKAPSLTGRAYPVLYNTDVAQFIGDAQALVESRQISAEHLGAILQSRITSMLTDQGRAVRVLRVFGQCLLWICMLALVLGVMKTLASVDGPHVGWSGTTAALLGYMLAHALVAPLLGIFLAAGIVYPLARRLEAAIADDAHVFEIIRMAFFCRAAGSDAELAVRMAYGLLPADFGMTQSDLSNAAASAQPA